jgi:putative glutamine amidotransferase
MNEDKSSNPPKAPPRSKRRRRWLGALAIASVILVGAFLLMRFAYPVWLQMRLPKDAPRIAFSLDSTLLGQVGITDATYQRVMAGAGGRLVKLRPDASEAKVETAKALLEEERIDGVLLTGGGDVDPNLYGGEPGRTNRIHRLRDAFEIALIRAARNQSLPVLGICRGCQILNVALGGTVRNLRKEQDIKGRHMVLSGHPVNLAQDSKLAQTLGVSHLARVISLHGQAVGELGSGVRIAATGPGDVIEAIEADSGESKGWLVGVQWHPELTLDDHVQQMVFEELVSRARKARQRRLSVLDQDSSTALESGTPAD